MKNKIIIVSGDPNSINSEIIYKSWKNLHMSKRKNIYVISNYLLLKKQFKILKYSIKIVKVDSINDNLITNNLKILDIPLKFINPFKVPFRLSSIFIKKALNLAHNLALKKTVKGIINCPIDKRLLNKKNSGVTEYLASKCKIKDDSEAMLIKGKNLSVLPITTHINVKKISKKISEKLIMKKVFTFNNWFKLIYKKKPKIGILGLNPHNAELNINSEEFRIIVPAIKKLKRKGFEVTGPLIADTVFINEYKNYDVIIGMYHDQVLAPFKAIFKFNAVNISLGLKYLRLSPDHGVARNILKKKLANHLSLLRCIEFLNKLK